MSIAQHAEKILEAWEIENLSDFNAALDEALVACSAHSPASPLEAEREEMLESIIEHIEDRDGREQLPEYSSGAAVVLLRHLSSSRIRDRKLDWSTKIWPKP